MICAQCIYEGFERYAIVPGTMISDENTIESILLAVTSFAGISIDELKSKTRKREMVEARFIAATLFKRYLNRIMLKEICEILGRTNHATIIHMLTTADDLMQTDRKFSKLFNRINTSLNFTPQTYKKPIND